MKSLSFHAFGLIAVSAVLIGFADNHVRVIAAEHGLWQFHATRSALSVPVVALVAFALGHRLRPVNLRAVGARSLIHGTSMLLYFGALAFLPVALVAAGLFTAPIFVLLIARLAYGERIRTVDMLAVAIGFAGIILLLGPQAFADASWAALLPVLAGGLYAWGNMATMRWCAAESAETLLAGFFLALGLLGAGGLIVLALMPVVSAPGADGFVLRGWQAPTGKFMFWVTVQAVLSVVAVGMMILAYQRAAAAMVSVFEYTILPVAALWGLVLWGERLTTPEIGGMGLIVIAGIVIALAPGQPSIAARQ